MWSESLIKNGLAPSLVDDPLFRKALVTTSQMRQAGICLGKGAALGSRRDTTSPHCHTFTQTIIPETDKSLEEEGMVRMKAHMQKVGATLMSDVHVRVAPVFFMPPFTQQFLQ